MSFKQEIQGAELDVDAEAVGKIDLAHDPAKTHLFVDGKEIALIERMVSVGSMALSLRQCLVPGAQYPVDLSDIIGETKVFELFEDGMLDPTQRKDTVKFHGKVERFGDMSGEGMTLRRSIIRVFDFIEDANELRAVEPGREVAGA